MPLYVLTHTQWSLAHMLLRLIHPQSINIHVNELLDQHDTNLNLFFFAPRK